LNEFVRVFTKKGKEKNVSEKKEEILVNKRTRDSFIFVTFSINAFFTNPFY